MNVFSQVNVKNNGVLYNASSTDTVFIGGAFTNESGAALTNNGVLNVKQDIINNQASMSAGTGTLYLNGTVTQTISGAQVFKAYNLVTDNTSGFIINNNLSVGGVHTFINGILTTSATPNYMVYETGAAYSGDNDSRHINGWVKKYGNSDFIFPVGNAVYERGIALTGLTAVSEFNIRHVAATPPNNINLLSPLVLVDTNEYWTINKISGGSANVVLTWDDSKFPIPQVTISNLRAAYYNGTKWTSIGGAYTGTVPATGTLTSTATASFNNDFTIGSIAVILPLQLIEFNGQKSGSGNLIKWAVTNEVNINEYELQRSSDGVNFYRINNQPAVNRNNISYYSYSDKATLNVRMFYRLMYTDNNGLLKYSNIITVDPENMHNGMFYVIGNPFQDKIAIYVGNNYKGKYNYTLTSNMGQVVQSGAIEITVAGIQTISMQAHIASGTYFLVLFNANRKLQQKVLKS